MNRPILALDLGQKTGWATINADGQIASGTEKFEQGKVESAGPVWNRFRMWLGKKIIDSECDIIVYEDVRSHRGTTAAHWYGGFLAFLTATASLAQINCRGVGVGTIKQSACGFGNASKTDVLKAMHDLGHNPMDDNEADALAILHWAIDCYDKPLA